jgi:2-methylfumaryl-CoA hydratase
MILAPPYAEDLVLDVPLERAPAITLDSGLAAAYLAISGDVLPLAVSAPLSRAVTGSGDRLANPALVLSVAIGQSTVATRRVIANLSYRDVALARPVFEGETLSTQVVPVAASWTRSGTDRAKVLLDIAVDSDRGDRVAHFQRLALIPVADPARLVERDVPAVDEDAALDSFTAPDWDYTPLAGAPLHVGDSWTDPLRDTVSSARELVRLTANLAAAHRDEYAGIGGRRLAYGGHTVALAQASLSRTVSGLATVAAWRSCDHVAPVFEDDLLETSVTIDAVETAGSARLVDATVEVRADRGQESTLVLRWRPVLVVGGAA